MGNGLSLSTTENRVSMSYRIRNWSEYNAGLKQRGSLTFWLSEDILDEWMNREATGRRGASLTYSDLAIATFETLKSIYGLAGRQTEGLLHSLFDLMGVDLPVPEHSTVSRRKGQLSITLPVVPKTGSVHLVVDSTGIKVYGEGEWKTRQHGVSKRRRGANCIWALMKRRRNSGRGGDEQQCPTIVRSCSIC
jgi:hypothetical protein